MVFKEGANRPLPFMGADMPTMESMVDHRFGTRELKAGDTFEADDREASLLIAMRRARRYTTREMKPKTIVKTKKRKYQRRDMQAQT